MAFSDATNEELAEIYVMLYRISEEDLDWLTLWVEDQYDYSRFGMALPREVIQWMAGK